MGLDLDFFIMEQIPTTICLSGGWGDTECKAYPLKPLIPPPALGCSAEAGPPDSNAWIPICCRASLGYKSERGLVNISSYF